MLAQEQIDFFHENGFLRIPQVYNEEEITELSDSLDRLIQDWAITSPGWSGPWRDVYFDEELEKQVKLTAMHDLHLYSDAWMRAVTNPKLAQMPVAAAGFQRGAAPYHHAHQAAADRAIPSPCIKILPSTNTPTAASSTRWCTWMTPSTRMARFVSWRVRTKWASFRTCWPTPMARPARPISIRPIQTWKTRCRCRPKRGDVVVFHHLLHSRLLHQPDERSAAHGAHGLP